MVGHARYPRIDGERIASQSRAIVTGLLRDQLGFDGVVMTDSLEAEAVDAATPATPTSPPRRSARSAPAPTCCC